MESTRAIDYHIDEISSLNLRSSRGKQSRELNEIIDCMCGFCNNLYQLGDNGDDIAIRLRYVFNGASVSLGMCAKCADVFADLCRFGPQVIDSANTWKRRTRLLRMYVVESDLVCFNCPARSKTHVFLKFDDMRYKNGTYATKRVCARCSVSFFEMMLGSFKALKCEYPFEESVIHEPYAR